MRLSHRSRCQGAKRYCLQRRSGPRCRTLGPSGAGRRLSGGRARAVGWAVARGGGCRAPPRATRTSHSSGLVVCGPELFALANFLLCARSQRARGSLLQTTTRRFSALLSRCRAAAWTPPPLPPQRIQAAAAPEANACSRAAAEVVAGVGALPSSSSGVEPRPSSLVRRPQRPRHYILDPTAEAFC